MIEGAGLPDTSAVIAAVALSRGLPLHTANPSDFPTLAGLDVVAVTIA